ncbi:MAG: hypothetical protein ABEJ08_06040 [Halobacteriaceae archaeon]
MSDPEMGQQSVDILGTVAGLGRDGHVGAIVAGGLDAPVPTMRPGYCRERTTNPPREGERREWTARGSMPPPVPGQQ